MTRYELLDRIGVGGMAEIFRGKAVAAGGFEKPVAIKRILPHLSQDRRFVELLIAEAKVLSLLKHRNIVQIFDVGLGDDGQYFLVMEFVDGKDIGAVQRALETQRRKLPFDLALHIGAEICEALEHAVMSRGPDGKPMSLVHRDVSPSNVLVSRAGEVKLTDFGIAKRAEQDATHGGAVRGKFAYISPEQARNEHLDPRSDVFSVGILMWEMVCNRRLFSQLGDLEALRAVREPVIRKPSEIDPRLPPEIDDIVMIALARDKSRRHASPGVLGAKLRSLRYSLDTTSGDPATELARIVESTEEVERQSKPPQTMTRAVSHKANDFDLSEATVIRIQTADAFSTRDDESSIIRAREVINQFEDEETRLAQLSGDQMRMLRAAAPRDSDELPAPTVHRKRTRAPSDEATRARLPMMFDEDPPTTLPVTPVDGNTPPHQHFSASEETRLFQSRDRRTPQPQPISRDPASYSISSSSPSAARAGRPPSAPPTASSSNRSKPASAAQPVSPQPMPGLNAPTLPGAPAPGAPAASAPAPQPGVPAPRPPVVPSFGAPPAFSNWGPPIAAQRPPRDATPTAQDSFDRPVFPPQRPSIPHVAGFGQKRPAKYGLKPWMLIAGAILVAILAFVITRAFIS
ncbi:MAG TPA: protein kinase [Kofleriaceae bacterium]|nr:protein kinase [Kofleriaceae bacterium]